METYEAPQNPAARKVSSGLVWNILTIVMLVGVVLLVAVFAIIFANPYVPINPFPPEQVPALLMLPTTTPTLKQMPATWTLTPTFEPTATGTPQPVEASPTAKLFSIAGTATDTVSAPTEEIATPTLEPPVQGAYPFALYGQPVAIASTITRPDTTCDWLGVAGQVFDMQNAAMVGYTVQLGGYLNSTPMYILTMSGTALQYGTAGFEFTVADEPADSKQTLWLQVLDQAGLPLSEKVYFDTYDDCDKNLILINFRQVK